MSSLVSSHWPPDVQVGKLSPFSVSNCKKLFENASQMRYGPNQTTSHLPENSSFLEFWSNTIIHGLKFLILCHLSKVIFLRLWMASICWTIVHLLSSSSSSVVNVFFNDWLSVRCDSTTTRNDSTSNSMGKFASNPYTNKNGVAWVVSLKVIRETHNVVVNLTY